MKLAAAALALLAACHEVARTRTITSAQIEPLSTSVVFADEVKIAHPCAARTIGYVLTFGLLWIVDSALEAKHGYSECPRIETRYEHQARLSFPAASSDPRRDVRAGPPACVFATPGDGCVVGAPPVPTPAWFPQGSTRHVDAVAPDGKRLVAATGDEHCAIVTATGERSIDSCSGARFLDNQTVLVTPLHGRGEVVDADSGVVLGRDDAPIWLGGRLAARWHPGTNILDIVRVDGWVTTDVIELIAAFPDRGALELVGRHSLIELRPVDDTVEQTVNVPIDAVLDVRGDLMLVRTPEGAAVIRLPSGEIVGQRRDAGR